MQGDSWDSVTREGGAGIGSADWPSLIFQLLRLEKCVDLFRTECLSWHIQLLCVENQRLSQWLCRKMPVMSRGRYLSTH